MIEYIIGAILLLITVLIILLILRKRAYDQVDALEAWKIDLMNRNVASELSKIKELNLSGETQRKFEKWRDRWERIVATDLADIEEALFDAEEAADRFLFTKVNKTLSTLSDALEKVEVEINKILEELNLLLQAEEDSREQITNIHEEIEQLKRNLLEESYKYGNAERYFENAINEIQNSLLQYDDFVEEGEYTKAQEHVQQISVEVEELKKKMEAVPSLYQKCNKDLPKELRRLTLGLEEMNSEGFRISPYGYDKELQTHKESLQHCINALEQGQIAEVLERVTAIENRISEIYDTLEQEAIARNYVESKMDTFMDKVYELSKAFVGTRSQIKQLKSTYFLEDQHMERFLLLEKAIQQADIQARELMAALFEESLTHLQIREKLEIEQKQVEELREKHEMFKETINNLRKDELQAKKRLDDMRSRLNQVNRYLKMSNLPGVPDFLWDHLEDSEQSLVKVEESLKGQPLDISLVQHTLEEADQSLSLAEEETNKVIDQCYLTEQVIQYANRYRSQYPVLSAQLSEAERLFRDFEYELALEKAASAIEEIEPGALRKIEENQKYRKSI